MTKVEVIFDRKVRGIRGVRLRVSVNDSVLYYATLDGMKASLTPHVTKSGIITMDGFDISSSLGE